MRVVIDASAAMRAERTGVGRYVENLVAALGEIASPEDRFQIAYRASRWRRRHHRLRLPSRAFDARWFQGRIGLGRADVAHGPDGRILDARDARRVVTIHDVFALEPDGEGTDAWRRKMRARYALVAGRAHRVICLSDWSKERFLHHHDSFDPVRVVVVPPGVEARFRPEAVAGLPRVRARLGLDAPYALFLGAFTRRKNPDVLLDAWARMPADAPTLLLMGSGAGRREALVARARDLGLGERVRIGGWVPDGDLPALLAGASLLAVPSRLEGYGLPALEALASGVPVVHSGRGGLAEATAGCGLVVDPEDSASVAGGCLRVLEDVDLVARLRSDGLARAAALTWEQTARATLDAYADA